MFANRFTALIDACSLVDSLKRNILLSLADAGFYRIRWSDAILEETERAILSIRQSRGVDDPYSDARRARVAMETAFPEATVAGFDDLLPCGDGMPDPNDRHVLAAAIKAEAAVIVTENLKDFPATILDNYEIETKVADAFIADTLNLDIGLGVSALRQMRERFKKPTLTAHVMLVKMEAVGLTETVNELADHLASL